LRTLARESAAIRNPAIWRVTRYDYFHGVQLQFAAPLVYAPALRFHFTDVLLEILRPEMEVIRIGLAESWRRGLRVIIGQKLCRKKYSPCLAVAVRYDSAFSLSQAESSG
jgi:hypothetical protein